MMEATKSHEGTRREIPFADEVFAVIGAAMEVHSHLGPGFLESVYEEALAIELELRGIPFRRQVPLEIHYKQRILTKSFTCDKLAFDAILIELKAIPALGMVETAQLLNYLKATGRPIGLLLNFGKTGKLDWQRFAGPHLSPQA